MVWIVREQTPTSLRQTLLALGYLVEIWKAPMSKMVPISRPTGSMSQWGINNSFAVAETVRLAWDFGRKRTWQVGGCGWQNLDVMNYIQQNGYLDFFTLVLPRLRNMLESFFNNKIQVTMHGARNMRTVQWGNPTSNRRLSAGFPHCTVRIVELAGGACKFNWIYPFVGTRISGLMLWCSITLSAITAMVVQLGLVRYCNVCCISHMIGFLEVVKNMARGRQVWGEVPCWRFLQLLFGWLNHVFFMTSPEERTKLFVSVHVWWMKHEPCGSIHDPITHLFAYVSNIIFIDLFCAKTLYWAVVSNHWVIVVMAFLHHVLPTDEEANMGLFGFDPWMRKIF